MKKLTLAVTMLSGILAYSQEKPKTDSTATKNLENVTITKKVFQKKADRVIYDVAASPATKGNTAFDLLKETPTVTTSDDKEFKILGKSAVVVFINGRKANMDANAILAMLKSTASENVSKIEVISAPGSEFDVPGNTGVINIVMKKKNTDGYSGTLQMQNNQGYYNNPSSNASLNFRKGKLGGNISGGYGAYQYRQGITLENGNSSYKTMSEGYVTGPSSDLNLNSTLDYDLSDKDYLTWSINTSFNRSKASAQKFSNQYFVNNILTDETEMQGLGNDKSKNLSTSLGYDYSLDDKGSKIKLNAAYLYYTKNSMDATRNFQLPGYAFVSGFDQITPQDIYNFSVLADYIKKLKDGSTVSFGGNFNKTKTDNDTQFLVTADQINFSKNPDLSNHFIYNETIGALYANYERSLGKKVSMKGGVRYEMTGTKGDILGKDDPLYHFKENYGNILPFLNLNYAISENNNLSYNFSSRIRRPSFWELNPVRMYTTTTNYIQNNPFMLPSKIYSQELMYMYKNAYFFTLSHTFTKDESTQIPLQKLNANNLVELRYIRTNYGNSNEASATLGMQKMFWKGRWMANYSVTGIYKKYSGTVSYDPLTHESFDPYVVDRSTKFAVFNASNQLALDTKKTWWLGADYFLVTPQELELGKLDLLNSLNLSLKKNWENWTFKAAVNDVFDSQSKVKIINRQANGFYNNVYQNGYSRNFSASITYNFGNQKIRGARQDESANKDIKNRTGGK